MPGLSEHAFAELGLGELLVPLDLDILADLVLDPFGDGEGHVLQAKLLAGAW